MSNGAISIVTLGVDDLDRSLRFYEALGWVNTRQSQESVKFLQGKNIVLGLYGRESLARDVNFDGGGETGFTGISLAVNLDSKAAVDACYKTAINAGGIAQKPPEKAFWGGYSGYFRDLDGHFWEVAHNPFFEMDEHGNLALDCGAAE